MDDQPTFEQALAGVQAAVRDLEDGTLGLQESLARFEAGVKLLRVCHATLDRADRRVDLLTGIAEDGAAETEPFDASATAEQAGAGRRKSPAKKKARPRKKAEPVGEPAPAADPGGADGEEARGSEKRETPPEADLPGLF